MSATKTIKDKVKSKVHSQDSIPSFIRKTYDILEESKFPEVIDWNPEGTALVIKKPAEFCQKVLPLYFKHNNLTSFVRQLNMYNFHKRRTQNIDHVYYHELFQKGKKHLLKEIRRKNHETTSEKGQKSAENIETPQAGKDVPTLLYENQALRRLYNDALNKVAALENQVRDLTGQNQNLWTQLRQHSDHSSTQFNPVMRAEKQLSLTPDQLPMTFGDISIPPLKLVSEAQSSTQSAFPLAKPGTIGANGYLHLSEISAVSTEPSFSPPSLRTNTESDKGLEITNNIFSQPAQLPRLHIRSMPSDLLVSRQEMSVGQLFEAWNQEAQGTDLICFADQQQKNDKNAMNVRAMFQDPSTVLGKRLFDGQQQGNVPDQEYDVAEPTMKRQDLSIFNRRSLISTGTEDKEFLKALIRRESSINDEFDVNMGIDLMDFNQPFLNSTKASS